MKSSEVVDSICKDQSQRGDMTRLFRAAIQACRAGWNGKTETRFKLTGALVSKSNGGSLQSGQRIIIQEVADHIIASERQHNS
jgi:hypothetical protein